MGGSSRANFCEALIVSRYRVELLEAAEDDAREIYVRIYQDSPASAKNFAETLDVAIPDLGETAHTWDAKKETKRYLINRYRVTLVYRLYGDLVKVGAVAHQRRKIGYWGKRDF